ncbi:hypothetical protein B0H21DRAFT_693524, partial [Amylocystis lapponica]
MKTRAAHYENVSRNARRKVSRAEDTKRTLRLRLHHIQSVTIPVERKEAAKLLAAAIAERNCNTDDISSVAGTDSPCDATWRLEVLGEKERSTGALKQKLRTYQKSIRILKQRCYRAPRLRAKAVDKAKSKALQQSAEGLRRKGVYTPKTRALVRALVHGGCSVSHVGGVMREIGKAIGFQIQGKFDKRTVARINLEGGIASEMQIAHEMENSASITLSGDGTTHRHTNYEARFAAIPAPSYSPGDSSTSVPQMRLLGVDSAVDHTSQRQFSGWMKKFDDLTTVYGNSPLASRSGSSLLPADIAQKLRGMNGDHAEDQKKTFQLMKGWKEETTQLTLGSRELLLKPSAELFAVLAEATIAKVAAAGGPEAWELLSAEEQKDHDVNMLRELYQLLGHESYLKLSDDEKRQLDLCIWAGCSMHKELNSVKGGNTSMMGWWKEHGVDGPVLLANKDNDATLQGASSSTAVTAAELRALEVSTCGGVKATTLAGAIFNHKD